MPFGLAITGGEPVRRAHLSEAEAERFFRGELGKAERCRLVRHLLQGCPVCLAVTRPVWQAMYGGREARRQ